MREESVVFIYGICGRRPSFSSYSFVHCRTHRRFLYACYGTPFVPNGQVGDDATVAEDRARPGQALDLMLEISAVGRHGGAPLPNFLESS
jgi:hypothetical protein